MRMNKSQDNLKRLILNSLEFVLRQIKSICSLAKFYIIHLEYKYKKIALQINSYEPSQLDSYEKTQKRITIHSTSF